MHYIKQNLKADQPTFVLFHGTGGDEESLLPIASYIQPDYGLISLRGEVDENGAKRFFKRKAEGVYDVEDLHQRSKDIMETLKNISEEENIPLDKMIPLGFSNGANIIIDLLITQVWPVKQALILAPMYPVAIETEPDFSDLSVFLSMGKNDPIVPLEESQHVVQIFEEAGADVFKVWVNSHEITQEVILGARQFLGL